MTVMEKELAALKEELQADSDEDVDFDDIVSKTENDAKK
jgi:hypothetical protein